MSQLPYLEESTLNIFLILILFCQILQVHPVQHYNISRHNYNIVTRTLMTTKTTTTMMMMMVRRFAGVWALRDSNSGTRPCHTSRLQQPQYQTRGPRVTQTIIIILHIIVCHIRDTSR